jgi:hypothetical protein
VTGVPHLVFNITDTDLVKQIQIKTIRATNKGKQLTKEQVAGKVWKYRYIPPALESDYFERNFGDNKEITKIKQLIPTDPFKRNEYKEPTPTTWVRPGLKSEYLASKKIISDNPKQINPEQQKKILKDLVDLKLQVAKKYLKPTVVIAVAYVSKSFKII